MRAAACRSCRVFLTSDEQDEALRPKQRTETGAVADALPSEHNRAYLQHDVHAEPVVRFFLRYFESERSIEPQGIRILVYTRWDSAHLGPETFALTFGRDQTADADDVGPPITFELYNTTGSGFTGTHYDPMMPAAGARARASR